MKCSCGQESRYKCPGCRIGYCSVPCFKVHSPMCPQTSQAAPSIDFSVLNTAHITQLLGDPMLQLSLLHLNDNPADIDGFLERSPGFKHFASVVLDKLNV